MYNEYIVLDETLSTVDTLYLEKEKKKRKNTLVKI